MHKKQQQFTPWEEEQPRMHLDKIMMTTRNNLNGRLNIVNMVAINKIGQTQFSSEEMPRMNVQKQIYKQRISKKYQTQQKNLPEKQKVYLKKIQLSSLLGIGKGLVGQVAVLKKQIQDKMRRYLLLVYLAQQLKQQVSSSKNQISKQKFQCLFPIIGANSNRWSKYKIRRSLNDLISLERT